MRVPSKFYGVFLALAMSAAACGTPPTADVDSAKAAFDKAAKSAGQYAQASLKAAQEAEAALDAELAVQQSKWFKSYDRTKELAAAARSASEKASADALAARERAEAVAAKAKAETEARAKLMSTAVRVGGAVRNPTKTKNVSPEYPAIAKSARVGGTVQVEATIGPDGKVSDARVVKSIPLLDQAALDAVKQWEYKPTMVKGVAVPVIITVAINFQP
jgi:periplasmic protein TonB